MPFITIPIDGGLDLLNPPVTVLPGRLQDCENFEVAINQGVRSIDGYERFDGGYSPSGTQRLWSVELGGNEAGIQELVDKIYIGYEADISYSYQGGVSGGNVYAVVFFTMGLTDVTGRAYIAAKSKEDSLILDSLVSGQNGYVFNGLTITLFQRGGVNLFNYDRGAFTANAVLPTAADNQTAQAAYYNIVRATVQEVPGQGNVLGLFWLKDELYACRDYFTLAYEDSVSSASYNDELFIGASYAAATWKGFLAKNSVLSANSLTEGESGVMMFYNTTGTATTGTLKNHTQGDIDVATVTAINAGAQGAGLYKATGERGTTVATQSWKHQDIGYRVRYKDGEAAFVPANRVTATTSITDLIQDTEWVVPDNFKSTGGAWVGVGGGAFPSTSSIQTDDGDASYFICGFTSSIPKPPFWVNDFGLSDTDIPDGSTITGFTVEITRRGYTGGTSDGEIRDYVVQLKFASDSGVTGTTASFANRSANWPKSAVTPDNPTYAAVTYGGKQSLLGYGNVTPDSVKDTEFGFFMNTECIGYSGVGTVESRITLVRLKVHFIPPQSKIYFWNGTSAVLAEVVMSYQTSGSVANTDAKGHLFLMNVGTNRAVEADEEIRTYPGAGVTPDGGGSDGSSLIALSENSMTKNVMDWSSLLTGEGKNPNKSKYQYVTGNFTLAADFDAIYGVSGAGPAFMYDGYAFTRIYTGTPEQDDTPRHVGIHQSRLTLGYLSGSYQFSVAGNPLSFDPLNFAGEIPFSSAIRGIMELNGDTVAILTQKGVSMIQGDMGLNPYPGVISPDVGCVEYSGQSMGQYLYTSFRGMQNLRATQSYGDFDTSQFSWDVWSFLRPRVQQSIFFESNNIGVINSLPVRNKSQYRLMFADGKQLTGTFLREGELPQFTIQQYYHANGTTPLTWDVVTAGVESNGRDRLFGATNDGTGYVYEIDRGYSFDGGAIVGYVTLVVDDQRSPYQNKEFVDCQVYGLATDYATFTMSRAVNYGEPTSGNAYSHTFGSATATPTGEEGYASSATPVRIAGRNISFRFDVNSATQPPLTIQAISVFVVPAGDKRS